MASWEAEFTMKLNKTMQGHLKAKIFFEFFLNSDAESNIYNNCKDWKNHCILNIFLEAHL